MKFTHSNDLLDAEIQRLTLCCQAYPEFVRREELIAEKEELIKLEKEYTSYKEIEPEIEFGQAPYSKEHFDNIGNNERILTTVRHLKARMHSGTIVDAWFHWGFYTDKGRRNDFVSTISSVMIQRKNALPDGFALEKSGKKNYISYTDPKQ